MATGNSLPGFGGRKSQQCCLGIANNFVVCTFNVTTLADHECGANDVRFHVEVLACYFESRNVSVASVQEGRWRVG
eukprot:3641410-Prorocentrum_lima.AAC.1